MQVKAIKIRSSQIRSLLIKWYYRHTVQKITRQIETFNHCQNGESSNFDMHHAGAIKKQSL